MPSVVKLPAMQTNAIWKCDFQLLAGTPQALVDITGWDIAAAVRGPSSKIDLTVGNGKLSINSPTISLSLSEADCAALGVGPVAIELMRISQGPRPLGRVFTTNVEGIYP